MKKHDPRMLADPTAVDRYLPGNYHEAVPPIDVDKYNGSCLQKMRIDVGCSNKPNPIRKVLVSIGKTSRTLKLHFSIDALCCRRDS